MPILYSLYCDYMNTKSQRNVEFNCLTAKPLKISTRRSLRKYFAMRYFTDYASLCSWYGKTRHDIVNDLTPFPQQFPNNDKAAVLVDGIRRN